MKAFPRIVSFFTLDTPYQWLSESFIHSCKENNAPYDVQAISSFGSWEMNCCYKPLFLLQMLTKWNEPLLWIDIDAALERPLVWGEFFRSDIAVRAMPHCSTDHPSKIITGTLFINCTKPAVKLLESWAKLCMQELADPQRTQEVWDQDILRKALRSCEDPLQVGILPAMYDIIHKDGEFKEICDNPVIMHHRASKFLKGYVNQR